MKWKQEKPSWCKMGNRCIFKRRKQDAVCAGELLTPESHGKHENTHRLCINQQEDDGSIKPIVSIELNKTDIYHLRWVLVL